MTNLAMTTLVVPEYDPAIAFYRDAFGMEVAEDSIVPASEFVWREHTPGVMVLAREHLRVLLDMNINERLNVSEPLLIYMRREDLPGGRD